MTALAQLSFAGKDARARWCSTTKRLFQVEDVEIGDPADFRGGICHAKVGALDFSHVVSSREWARRAGGENNRRGDESVMLVRVLEGDVLLKRRGGECRLGPDRFVLYRANEAYEWQHERFAKVRNIAIPQPMLAAHIRDFDKLMGRPIDGSSTLWRLASTMMDTIFEDLSSIPQTAEHKLTSQLIDLVALGLSTDAASAEGHPSMRAASFQRCKAAIRARLWDVGLTPQTVAQHSGVSLRTLHRLFAEQGQSVSGMICLERLDAACTRLLDPCQSGMPIAEIALRVGFRSAAHFSTSFKSQFGMTPSDCRNSRRDPRASCEAI